LYTCIHLCARHRVLNRTQERERQGARKKESEGRFREKLRERTKKRNVGREKESEGEREGEREREREREREGRDGQNEREREKERERERDGEGWGGRERDLCHIKDMGPIMKRVFKHAIPHAQQKPLNLFRFYAQALMHADLQEYFEGKIEQVVLVDAHWVELERFQFWLAFVHDRRLCRWPSVFLGHPLQYVSM